MQRSIHPLILSAFLACSAVSIAAADNLYLRDGQTVHGTFLGGSAREVKMEVNGQIRSYDIGQIQSLTFDAPPPEPQPDRFSAVPPAPAAPPAPSAPPAPMAPPSSPPPGRYASVPAPHGFTIPADTTITVRMVDSVNSDTSRLGQTFMASLDEPIVIDGRTIVPRGADIMTKLVDDQDAGKLSGRTVQTLALVSMNVNGQWMDVSSNDVRTESGSQGSKTAKLAGGGAVLGAILGGIAGGGKGAAIGTVSGAAVGTGASVATSGQKVVIPSETRLTFRLQQAAQIP
ncbi:MAG TPA: hypothetical protein VHC90_01635 [Bryobacteraceae bacterium]|nr:hypothetical protein [Bryobacteraceae bacterium]